MEEAVVPSYGKPEYTHNMFKFGRNTLIWYLNIQSHMCICDICACMYGKKKIYKSTQQKPPIYKGETPDFYHHFS